MRESKYHKDTHRHRLKNLHNRSKLFAGESASVGEHFLCALEDRFLLKRLGRRQEWMDKITAYLSKEEDRPVTRDHPSSIEGVWPFGQRRKRSPSVGLHNNMTREYARNPREMILHLNCKNTYCFQNSDEFVGAGQGTPMKIRSR